MLKTQRARRNLLTTICVVAVYMAFVTMVWFKGTISTDGYPKSHHSWLWFQGAGVVWIAMIGGGLAAFCYFCLFVGWVCEKLSDWISRGEALTDTQKAEKLVRDMTELETTQRKLAAERDELLRKLKT